ncbi:MAG: DnaT-like ssDNA-binding protein [Gemmatimonas sp.]
MADGILDFDVGGAAANSTVSLPVMLAYCARRDVNGVNAFTRLGTPDPDNQRRVLIRACAELELLERKLCGERATITQRLSQPRIDGYRDPCASYVRAEVLSGAAIAEQWQVAQMERSIEIAEELEKKAAAATSTDLLAPFSEIKAGGVELKLRAPVEAVKTFSSAVLDRLAIFMKSRTGLRMVRQ